MGKEDGDRLQKENDTQREDEISRTAKRKNMKVNKPVIFCWLSREPEIQVSYSACSKVVPFLSVYIRIRKQLQTTYACILNRRREGGREREREREIASSREGLEKAQTARNMI
jgi:hypothetical protein